MESGIQSTKMRMRMRKRKYLLSVYFIGLCYILFLFTHKALDRYNREARPFKVYPPQNIKMLSLGFDEVLGNSFWLMLLQDSDFCENQSSEKANNNGKNLDEILSMSLKNSRCHLGWVYQVTHAITELMPKFKRIYRFGGEMLAIGVDDREGAKRIFDLGIERFPDYWPMVYSASYLYLYELQDAKRAAELLALAQKHGGPDWLLSLSGALYSRSGQRHLAITTLREFIQNNPKSRSIERLKKRLKDLERGID